MREVVHARSIKFPRVQTTGFHPDVFFVKRRYFSFPSFHRLREKQPKPIWESFAVRICFNVLQDQSFPLLSLILIHLADVYILVMACVDCARACSLKPSLASLTLYEILHRNCLPPSPSVISDGPSLSIC